jgi:hypothetical protein
VALPVEVAPVEFMMELLMEEQPEEAPIGEVVPNGV